MLPLMIFWIITQAIPAMHLIAGHAESSSVIHIQSQFGKFAEWLDVICTQIIAPMTAVSTHDA
jgi:hypothetical protein